MLSPGLGGVGWGGGVAAAAAGGVQNTACFSRMRALNFLLCPINVSP